MSNEIPFKSNGKRFDPKLPLIKKLSRVQLEELLEKLTLDFDKQNQALALYINLTKIVLGTLYAIYPQHAMFSDQVINPELLKAAQEVATSYRKEENIKNGIWTVDLKNKAGQTLHSNSMTYEGYEKDIA